MSICFLAVGFLCFYHLYIPKHFEREVLAAAAQFSVDNNLIYAVMRAESNFRADACSRSGAVGLMQIMPSTAEFICTQAGTEWDVHDPEENILLGVWYLRYLEGKFQDLDTVLAAYNAGEGVVRRWLSNPEYIDKNGFLFSIPYAETERYVHRVKNFYFCYKFFY